MEPETIAYFNLLETTLGYSVINAKKNAVDAFIVSEKNAGRWDSHKFIWIPVWKNTNANLICLKNAIKIGSYPYGASHMQGYVRGNGKTQYFNTNNSTSSILSLSSAHAFALVLNTPLSGAIFGVGQDVLARVVEEQASVTYYPLGIVGNAHHSPQLEQSSVNYFIDGVVGDTIHTPKLEQSSVEYTIFGSVV
jgi:hypothetical protein